MKLSKWRGRVFTGEDIFAVAGTRRLAEPPSPPAAASRISPYPLSWNTQAGDTDNEQDAAGLWHDGVYSAPLTDRLPRAKPEP